MPKYVIKEGIIEKFVTFFAKAAINKKNKMIQKVLQTDPKLGKLMKVLKDDEKDLYDYLKSSGELDRPDMQMYLKKNTK